MCNILRVMKSAKLSLWFRYVLYKEKSAQRLVNKLWNILIDSDAKICEGSYFFDNYHL